MYKILMTRYTLYIVTNLHSAHNVGIYSGIISNHIVQNQFAATVPSFSLNKLCFSIKYLYT